MRSDREKCAPSVKVRLAPLPTRNLNFGNSLNLEECLNRSVAMDRPSSRISELSNYSESSMISVARSNYEQQSDNLRRAMNRNVIEALRMKDTRRRKRNYLNENEDNYSVDLAFNVKRKRAYEDDYEGSDFHGQFLRPATSRQQGMKFARTEQPLGRHMSSSNRFCPSRFKNNEIVSSYCSIQELPTTSVAINHLSNQADNRQYLSQSMNQPRTYPTNIKKHLPSFSQTMTDRYSSPKQSPPFQMPVITISNSSSKENSDVSNTLSNASISPISRKPNDAGELSSSSLYKSLNVSSSMDVTDSENMSTSSGVIEQTEPSPKNTVDERDTMTKIKVKDDSPNYKIPEHFHSIDEHIHDERKARSRLGNFLKAIYNVTSPFISKTNSTQESLRTKGSEINPPSQTDKISSAPITFPTTTIITTSTNTKNSDTQFKLPSTSELKLNTTSTPLKLNFNPPPSNDKSSSNSSFVFKFGGEQSNKTITEQTNKSTVTTTSISTPSIFNFSASIPDKPKDTTANKFVLPSTTSTLSTSLSTDLKSTSVPNFQFGSSAVSQEASKQDSNNKTLFSINLPSTSNFNQFTNSASNLADDSKWANSSSIFDNYPKPADSNKPSGPPVFNFGSTTASKPSLKPATNAPSSIFSFGQTVDKQPQQSNSLNSTSTLNSSTLGKPATNNTFTFSNLNNTSFSASNSTTFKAPSNPTFNFGSTQTQNAMSQNSATINKPNFSFGSSNISDPIKSNDPLSSVKSSITANTNAGFNLNSTLSNTKNMNPTFNSIQILPLDSTTLNSTAKFPGFNFSAQQGNTSTPFKFDANQAKPSFNFGNSNNQPPSFNFSSSSTIPQFGSTAAKSDSTFTAPAFNSTSKNMFTIGRK